MSNDFILDKCWGQYHFGHGIYVFPNVKLGKNVKVEPNVILGKPPRKAAPGELELIIGDNSTIRSGTIIYAGTTIGEGFNTGHRAMIREDNQIGDSCSVGGGANIEYGNRIGNNTRIHAGCFLERTVLGEGVFVGPDVTFTDDPHPICPDYEKCTKSDAHPQQSAMGVVVGDYTSIGAKALLLPGAQVANDCLIGGGAIVSGNCDIPFMVYAGFPARRIKLVTDLVCGPRLHPHPYAWRDHTTPEKARAAIAKVLGCDPDKLDEALALKV